MRVLSVLVVLFVASTARTPVGQKTDVSPRLETAHLTVTTSTKESAAAPGNRVSLLLDVAPKPTMHVYAPGQPEAIPIAITLDPAEAFKAHATVYPKPEKYFFAPVKETMLVYSRPFRLVQDVTLASTAAIREQARGGGGVVSISGTLKYQACDDKVCYTPERIPVSWTIALKPSGR